VDIASLSRLGDRCKVESPWAIPMDSSLEVSDSKPSDVEMSMMELCKDVAGLAISICAVGPLLSMNFPWSRIRPTLH